MNDVPTSNEQLIDEFRWAVRRHCDLADKYTFRQVEEAKANLLKAMQPVETPDRIGTALGCFEAALAEGWLDALAAGDIERIRDIWTRRISFAQQALTGSYSPVEPTACLCNAPSLDCPVHPRPAEKASPLPIDREAANALALECAQASAVVRKCEKREWIFDRYRNDRLMAQGVKVHAVSYAEAYAEAVSLLFIDGNKPTDELRLQPVNGKGDV